MHEPPRTRPNHREPATPMPRQNILFIKKHIPPFHDFHEKNAFAPRHSAHSLFGPKACVVASQFGFSFRQRFDMVIRRTTSTTSKGPSGPDPFFSVRVILPIPSSLSLKIACEPVRLTLAPSLPLIPDRSSHRSLPPPSILGGNDPDPST
ncbi:hypothetical protein SERLA73DRAFT_74602 [Serpula lacrymans var. lacrymans S7.3]|uniref:Uncharacterized protein n=2 Tax=Serpula lacrymans var. lacrymans TaxID=341189 RepID=F8PZR2_SERL3|nr:uncharacterized protein SERLADRAFT_439248 [Serpula lacrymans var. lacrymans S7.9]EGN98384.1 hypothetical protein SERLA73DRAFT_74602 [Serpula lacrymans var. lacrymans S7.3]EGO23936.1 hypothetical protein SERLADRAFT_439248 [Serpula lacrymans var. lacrymans S7.9]